MRCLVTGAAGFIGSNLCRELRRRGHHVIAFDEFKNEEQWKNLRDLDITVYKGSISDAQDVNLLATYEYDMIFNMAAISDTLADSTEEVYKANVEGFRNMQAIAKMRAPKGGIVHASSAATYGKAEGAFKESAPQIPVNLYAWSKKLNDLDIMREVDYPVIGLKFFNVYGPGEDYKAHMKSVVGQKIDQALSGSPMSLFKDGTQKRDWIYIDDVVEMILMAGKAIDKKVAGVFNCGTGEARSFKEVAQAICSHIPDSTIKWIDNPYEDSYQSHTQADMTQFNEHIGEHKCLTLEEGIERYVNAKR